MPEESVVPKDVLQELIGVDVTLNGGPDVTYFTSGSEVISSEAYEKFYIVSRRSWSEACKIASRVKAAAWLQGQGRGYLFIDRDLCDYHA